MHRDSKQLPGGCEKQSQSCESSAKNWVSQLILSVGNVAYRPLNLHFCEAPKWLKT